MATPDALSTQKIDLVNEVLLFVFFFNVLSVLQSMKHVCVFSVWTAIERSTSGENHLCSLILLAFCFQGDNHKVCDWSKEAVRCVNILILPLRWK